MREHYLQKIAEKMSGKKSWTAEYLAARKGKVPVSPPTSTGEEGSSPSYPIDPINGILKASGYNMNKQEAIYLIKQALGEEAGMPPPGAGGPPPPEAGMPPPGAGAPPMDPMMMQRLEQHAMEHDMMRQMGLEPGGEEQAPPPPEAMGPPPEAMGPPPGAEGPQGPPEMQKESAVNYLKRFMC